MNMTSVHVCVKQHFMCSGLFLFSSASTYSVQEAAEGAQGPVAEELRAHKTAPACPTPLYPSSRGTSILLNSSKQAHAPAWASPLKNFPMAL